MEIKDATTTSLADDLKELNLDRPVTKQALKVRKGFQECWAPIKPLSWKFRR